MASTGYFSTSRRATATRPGCPEPASAPVAGCGLSAITFFSSGVEPAVRRAAEGRSGNEILGKMVLEGEERGLSEEFILKMFKAIHQESIAHQEKIINS